MSADPERKLQTLLAQYARKIFALSLHVAMGDKDQAYGITASAFAQAARKAPNTQPALGFLAREVIRLSTGVEFKPVISEWTPESHSSGERRVLGFVARAMYALPLPDRAALLLRDQLNVGYEEMAAILGISESQVRHRVLSARKEVRTHLEEMLRDAR